MCACGREFNGAPILEKVTNYYKETKPLKKGLTGDIIEPERKDGANHENKTAYKKATGILKSER